MALLTLRCTIEQIADWHPQLFLEPHIVACVALMGKYSDSPAVFTVECTNIVSRWLGTETHFALEVKWLRETARKADRLCMTFQSKPQVELAAGALAFVLASRVVPLEHLNVTSYGDRADYRSLTEQSVLEISGTETLEELERRHQSKVAQAMANPFGWDAYVVVCAFCRQGHRIRFSHQRVE